MRGGMLLPPFSSQIHLCPLLPHSPSKAMSHPSRHEEIWRLGLEWDRSVLQSTQSLFSFTSSGLRCWVLLKLELLCHISLSAWHFQEPLMCRSGLQGQIWQFLSCGWNTIKQHRNLSPTRTTWGGEILRIDALTSGKRTIQVASCEGFA